MNTIDTHPDEILVVDDTPASLKLLEGILSGAGYRVRLADDGELALRSAKIQPPALVLLDIRMPGMDGYEVCRRLKDDEKTRSIPVIFLSILEDEREKVKAFQIGGVDYINKPIHAAEVLARVNTHLTLRHAQLDLEARNVELEVARDTLEQRVKERSAELEQMNQRLQEQIDVHLHTLEALRESEFNYRRIVDTANEGIWALGSDYLTTFVNARMAEMLGYSSDEMIGRPVTAFMFDEDVPDHHARMEKRRQGLSENYERRYLRRDGQTVWTLASATPIFDAAGSFGGAFAMYTDITERKRAEDTIHALNETLERRLLALTQPVGDVSNLQLGDLFNIDELQKIQDAFALATGVASIITDTQGQPITKPSNFCRLCEHIIRKTEKGMMNCYRSDAALGRMHPEGPIMQPCLSGGLWDAGTSICVGDQHIANWLIGQVLEEPVNEEAMIAYAREIGADEEEFRKALAEVTRMPLKKFEEVAEALYLIAGQLSRLAVQNVQQARLITERKRAEQSLALLSFALSNVHEAAFLIDENARFHYVNEESCRILGYTNDELLGMGVPDVDPEFPLERWSDHWKELKKQGSLTFECRHKTKGGHFFPVEISANLFEYDGQAYNMALVRDITERKRTEEQKREFYCSTILAATEGKLLLTERDDVERIAGSPTAVLPITSAEDSSNIRNAVFDIARSHGMDESRVRDYVVAVGEAVANAVKHAGGGLASIHILPGAILSVVSDQGPGIEAMTIPEVALTRGYTTAGTLGMGYKIMISIADKVYLATGTEGTTVGIEIALQGAETKPDLAYFPTW